MEKGSVRSQEIIYNTKTGNEIAGLLAAEIINIDNESYIQEFLLDEKEIRQLILNLVRNGMESMSAGGMLTIKTYMDGDSVVLAVEDQGGGIDPEVRDKIGTPFFTTKDYGTGLGLATCYSIAERHGAKVEIDTCPAGTTFSIYFRNRKF